MMTTMIFCWFYFMKKGLKKKNIFVAFDIDAD